MSDDRPEIVSTPAAPATEPGTLSSAAAPAPEILASERRNLVTLSLHFVCLRLGWIFKTESVIMPAFLDTIAGAGWVRGFLPVLSRIGSSVPPLFYAAHLRNAPRKKWSLMGMTILMAIPFVVLSLAWFSMPRPFPLWLPGLFLFCHFLCFVGAGLSRLSFNTVQGKLIRDDRRGLLVSASGFFGSLAAIGCAVALLPILLGRADGFGWIFAFTAGGFVFAGLSAGLLREPADPPGHERPRPSQVIADTWRLFRSHRDFRKLAIISMMFISVQLAFPHFQRLGRDAGRAAGGFDEGFHMMLWVVAQSTGFGLFSVVSGWIADRHGNRLALRLQVLLLATTPLIAILLTIPDLVPGGEQLYWLPFVFLGLTPLTFRTINNYALELAPPAEHPRFVSTLSLALAVPIMVSPLVGLLVDHVGFIPVFSAISAVVFAAGLLTFTMKEPRDHPPPSADEIPPVHIDDALQ